MTLHEILEIIIIVSLLVTFYALGRTHEALRTTRWIEDTLHLEMRSHHAAVDELKRAAQETFEQGRGRRFSALELWAQGEHEGDDHG